MIGTSSASSFCDRSGLLRICVERSAEESIAPITAETNSLCKSGLADETNSLCKSGLAENWANELFWACCCKVSPQPGDEPGAGWRLDPPEINGGGATLCRCRPESSLSNLVNPARHCSSYAAHAIARSNVGHFLAQPNDDMSGDEVAHDARRCGSSVILSVVLLTLNLLHEMPPKSSDLVARQPTLEGWLG